jgi:hypothetical protein
LPIKKQKRPHRYELKHREIASTQVNEICQVPQKKLLQYDQGCQFFDRHKLMLDPKTENRSADVDKINTLSSDAGQIFTTISSWSSSSTMKATGYDE